MKHFNMNTVLVRTSALLLALMLCMTAFGCSNVRSVSNDKQNAPVSADKMSKDSSISEKVTETPELTAEPTPIPMPTPLPEPSPTYDYEQMIADLFSHINDGDFLDYANCYAPNVREMEVNMATNEWNLEQKTGVLNFKHVDILVISKLNDRYCRPAPDFSTEIDEKLLLDTDNFDCLYVKVNLDVFTPNEDYSDGEYEFVITTVKENGEWYVANIRAYIPNHHYDPTWMNFIDNYYDSMDK